MSQEIIHIDLEGVNCYLGKQEDNFVLFDTGGHITIDKSFDNRRKQLEKELEKRGCNSKNLKLIVLTHGDNDHVANAKYFNEKYNAKIAMHQNDLELVKNPTLEKVMRSFSYRSILLKIVFVFMKNLIKKVSIRTLDDFETFTPDVFVDEGDNLIDYGFDAKVIHIPGHTEGSIGIITAGGDILVGDTLVNTNKPAAAPNAVDFKLLKKSINRLKGIDLNTVYPGHGTPFKLQNLNN